MTEPNDDVLSWLMTSAREADAAGRKLFVDPGYVLEALARIRQLKAFAADLAAHGLRCDLNPTTNCADAMSVYTQMTNYLHEVEGSLRDRARAVIAEEVRS